MALGLLVPWGVDAAEASAGISGSAPVVVAGQLQEPDGRPASGKLALFAWPSQSGVREGEVVDLVAVARGSAGADGAFVLRAAITPALSSLAIPTNGHLNLMLRVVSVGRVERRFLTRLMSPDVSLRQESGGKGAWMVAPGEAPPEVVVRLATHSQPAGGKRAGQGQSAPGCTWGRERLTLKKRQEKVPTVVGELHTPSDTASASFLYGRRSDSVIGVAYRWPGGNWTVNGEHRAATSYEASEGIEGVGSGYSRRVRTTFAYGHYRALCDRSADPYEYDVIRVIEWQPTTIVEPANNPGCVDDPKSPHDQYVARYPKHGKFTRNQQRAHTWEGGVQAFGVRLASRSGYSQFVQASWRFGAERDVHLLCGNDASISHSTRIFAGPRPLRCGEGRVPQPCAAVDSADF